MTRQISILITLFIEKSYEILPWQDITYAVTLTPPRFITMPYSYATICHRRRFLSLPAAVSRHTLYAAMLRHVATPPDYAADYAASRRHAILMPLPPRFDIAAIFALIFYDEMNLHTTLLPPCRHYPITLPHAVTLPMFRLLIFAIDAMPPYYA